MDGKTFISIKEHKFLLATTLFCFCLIFSSVTTLLVKSYNESVAAAAHERMMQAQYGTPDYQISNCNFGQTYPEVWSRFFSFLFLPICFLILLKRRFVPLLISGALLLLPFVHFLWWFSNTQHRNFYLGFYDELNFKFWTEAFLYESNSFDLLLFYLLPVLIVWHAAIAARLFGRMLMNKPRLS